MLSARERQVRKPRKNSNGDKPVASSVLPLVQMVCAESKRPLVEMTFRKDEIESTEGRKLGCFLANPVDTNDQILNRNGI